MQRTRRRCATSSGSTMWKMRTAAPNAPKRTRGKKKVRLGQGPLRALTGRPGPSVRLGRRAGSAGLGVAPRQTSADGTNTDRRTGGTQLLDFLNGSGFWGANTYHIGTVASWPVPCCQSRTARGPFRAHACCKCHCFQTCLDLLRPDASSCPWVLPLYLLPVETHSTQLPATPF